MRNVNRREFLKKTSRAAQAVALAGGLSKIQSPLMAKPAAKGPNETIRVACIGVNGQGGVHIRSYQEQENVEVVAICDVDESVLNKQAEDLEKQTGRKVARHIDMRRLLEDKDIDIVSIATPNHWHSLAGIWAMQAGKDVYVEKPLSHNLWEGRQLVKAARKYNKLCQHGTQGRSSAVIREGIQKLREGIIGDVYMAKGICYKWRDSIGKKPDEPVPAGVNYDLWLGPAPKRAFSKNRFHYNWHWHWAYGNGDIGNQGVHEMDMARWGLGVELPSQVQCAGEQFLFDDDKEVPNFQIVSFSYPQQNKILTFEVRPWISNHEGGFGAGESINCGAIIFGSEGYMALEYFAYSTFLGRKREPGPKRAEEKFNKFVSFIAAVRSRKVEDLTADVEEGHRTAAHCHLANLAYRMGRTIRFDPKSERCLDDSEANKMLKRDYRDPFVVPDKV